MKPARKRVTSAAFSTAYERWMILRAGGPSVRENPRRALLRRLRDVTTALEDPAAEVACFLSMGCSFSAKSTSEALQPCLVTRSRLPNAGLRAGDRCMAMRCQSSLHLYSSRPFTLKNAAISFCEIMRMFYSATLRTCRPAGTKHQAPLLAGTRAFDQRKQMPDD